jgi:predicted nucleic acid-binding protein
MQLTRRARETLRVDEVLLSRAEKIQETGIMGMDAIHIACAEKAGAVFLTTDDEVIRIMKKHTPDILIRVDNPLRWLMELNHDRE